jgi:LPS O-antigen subunit length determinant protein (WzzB/FepE family)
MTVKSFLCAALLLSFPLAAQAQTAVSPQIQQQLIEKFQSMTPEQRQALITGAQDKWQKLTPTQKEMVKTQAIEQWNKLTPEQQGALQAEARNQASSTLKTQMHNQLNSHINPQSATQAKNNMLEKLQGATPEQRRQMLNDFQMGLKNTAIRDTSGQ